MKKITPKREKFCQNIVKGMNHSDSYRDSFNCENMKDVTINNNAYKLMCDNEIKTRIQELNKKIEDKLVYSAVESFNKFVELQCIAMAQENPQVNAAIKAEELKGKLARLYIEQSEVKHDATDSFKDFVAEIRKNKDYLPEK